MATVQDLVDAVAAEDSVIDSAVALIDGLIAQIAALKPDQASIDALVADVSAKKDVLAAKVASNTTS